MMETKERLQKDLKNLVRLGLKNLTTWKMMLKREKKCHRIVELVIEKTVIRGVVSNVGWAEEIFLLLVAFPKKMVFCKLPGVRNSVIFLEFCCILISYHVQGVWKSQKKSHWTMRAKRDTFTFWVDKSWVHNCLIVDTGQKLMKNAQNGPFRRAFENLNRSF